MSQPPQNQDSFGITHRIITANNINIHIAERGSLGSPVILFLHGFPELWYAWRHQMVALSELGYHCIAPDMRGYGGTHAPQDDNLVALSEKGSHYIAPDMRGYGGTHAPQDDNLVVAPDMRGYGGTQAPQDDNLVALAEKGSHYIAPPDIRGYGGTHAPQDDSKYYTYCHLVGDMVALLDEIGVEKVFVVGHDWGAVVAWWLCLFRPDRVIALVNMSVAFMPRNPKIRPIDGVRRLYGDDYYMCRFQVPGEMEEEIAEAGGADSILKKIFSYRTPGPLFLPKGKWDKDLPPYPSWMSEDDVAYYRDTFTKTGFTGGLNYYRALNLSWEITAPWTGAQVKVPTKFIVGDLDLTYHNPGVQDYINKGGMKKDVPLLQEVVILKGVGHFLQEETPDVINKHIYDFIQKF